MTGAGRCDPCDAPILWTCSSTSGKGLAVNPDPVPDGDVYVHVDPRVGGELIAHVRGSQSAENMRELGFTMRRRHSETCPHGASQRRREASSA